MRYVIAGIAIENQKRHQEFKQYTKETQKDLSQSLPNEEEVVSPNSGIVNRSALESLLPLIIRWHEV
jgi:hypothetical protein